MGNTNGQTLGLGSEGFRVYLNELWNGTGPFTVEQLVTALEATTMLQELHIMNEVFYEPTPEYKSRVMEPLCRCIANLRRHSPQHPLQKLILSAKAYTDDQTIRPFLEAAKAGGICQVDIESVRNLSAEYFVQFCRNHKTLESLTVWNVSMTAQTIDECDGSGDLPTHLKQFSLRDICFRSVRAATLFESLAGDMTLVGLELGKITIRDGDDDGLGNIMDRNISTEALTHGLEDEPDEDGNGGGGDDDEDDYGADDEDDVDNASNERFYGTDFYWPYDPKMSSRIVTKLLKPSVEELYLTRVCRKTHFKAALKATKTSIINLWVDVQRHKRAKLTILAHMIRRSVKLELLLLRNLARRPWLLPKPVFFYDVAACPTLTNIQLVRFHSMADRQLQEFVMRNQELAVFLENPNAYPARSKKILARSLTRTNCPLGLAMLTRGVPAVMVDGTEET